MERECYRCGAKMEEGAAFCPSCAAPQIRVNTPAADDVPATPPLDPGTPASMEPPAIPVQPSARAPISWKIFLRIALPVSLVAAVGVPILGILGLVLPIVGVIVAINLYQRRHPAPIGSALGARLGAVVGLFTFVFWLALALLDIAVDPAGLQRNFAQAREQLAANHNALSDQMLQFIATPQGVVIFTMVAMFLYMVLLLLFTAATGAFVGAASRSKNRV